MKSRHFFFQSILGAAAMISVLFLTPNVHAAQSVSTSGLHAVIIGPSDTPLKRTIILDASSSRIVGNNVDYSWYVGDSTEPISKTVDAIFTPEVAGIVRFRLVIHSVIGGQTVQDEQSHVVTVYRRKVVLISDASVSPEMRENLQLAAASGATYLRELHSMTPVSKRGGEEALGSVLTEQAGALTDADAVILWTDSIPTSGLQAIINTIGKDNKAVQTMQYVTLLLVTEQNLKTIARTAQGLVEALHAKRTLVVNPSVVSLMFSTHTADDFIATLQKQITPDQPFLDVSTVQISAWTPLSLLVNSLLTLGVSTQTILLLLMLPVIATILSFLRQVVGMSTFGLFTPAIIALSFIVLGWQVGLLFLAFILATGYASRSLTRRLHILYIPKMAIILCIGSLTLLLLLAIGTVYGIFLSHDTVFVLLIMSTLVESFLTVKSEQGLTSALLTIAETIIAALLCVFIVQWAPFRAAVVAYPELILLTIVINILLGRWTGLRITEYFRFREVFKHIREE